LPTSKRRCDVIHTTWGEGDDATATTSPGQLGAEGASASRGLTGLVELCRRHVEVPEDVVIRVHQAAELVEVASSHGGLRRDDETADLLEQCLDFIWVVVERAPDAVDHVARRDPWLNAGDDDGHGLAGNALGRGTAEEAEHTASARDGGVDPARTTVEDLLGQPGPSLDLRDVELLTREVCQRPDEGDRERCRGSQAGAARDLGVDLDRGSSRA
jgi:hypothetical protein